MSENMEDMAQCLYSEKLPHWWLGALSKVEATEADFQVQLQCVHQGSNRMNLYSAKCNAASSTLLEF